MSLEAYIGRRLVALSPHATANEGARLLRATHVGAIVVEDHDRAIGIVTDRDLALRVLGRGLTPGRVSLGQVMTTDVAVLHDTGTVEEAAELMRSLGVRRIPIVDRLEKPIGIITLDDLLVARLAFDVVSPIVQAQLEPRSGAEHPRHVRAVQALHDFEVRLQGLLEVDEPSVALEAFYVVASGIVRRLTPAEAHDFISQLPALVRERLYELPPGPDRRITLMSVDEDMAQMLRLPAEAAAGLVDKVAAALPLFVSEGELEDVRAHLPWRMRKLIRLAA
ncbi:MAG: CBS domain-containing protein [Myxococcaceae bacterium]|nr:CBS domain-containing protein [Myxococcaceae bacterium]